MNQKKDSSFDDTYIKRRTISAGEYVEVVINDIGHINESEIGIVIDVAEDKYLLKCSINETFDSPIGFSIFLDKISKNYKEPINLDDIYGTTLDLVFNSDMDKCGFEPDDYKFNIEYLENGEYNFSTKHSVDKSIRRLLLWSEYKKSDNIDGNNEGIKLDVDAVSEICDKSFELSVFTKTGSTITWDINIPLTTESDSSEVAKLIEEQGGGKPDYLDDLGEIIIVHETDVDKNLNFICYDKTNEWALVTPSTYIQWEKYEPSESNPPKNTTSTSTTPHVDGTLISKLVPMISFFLLYYIFINPAISELESQPDAPVELINLITNLTEFMITIMMVMMPLTIVLHYLKSQA